MVKVTAVDFFRQVRQEVSRVTWPSRKDTIVSTVMVVVMVTLASLIFLVIDMAIFHGVQFLLKLGS